MNETPLIVWEMDPKEWQSRPWWYKLNLRVCSWVFPSIIGIEIKKKKRSGGANG